MPFPYFVAGLLIEEEKEFQYAFYLAGELTLKAPITTTADDKFCNIFPSSWQK